MAGGSVIVVEINVVYCGGRTHNFNFDEVAAFMWRIL